MLENIDGRVFKNEELVKNEDMEFLLTTELTKIDGRIFRISTSAK